MARSAACSRACKRNVGESRPARPTLPRAGVLSPKAALGAPRSLASATEEQQLADVAATLQQHDIVSIARLTRAASCEAVSAAGCSALAAIFRTDDCCPTSKETQHAVEALVHALRAEPMSAGVQREGSRGLARLCKVSAEARTVAGAGGAVEAVVDALREHAGNSEVSKSACYALANLTPSSPGSCGRAHRAEALDALLNVMRLHPTHNGVLNCACLTLAYKCENVEGLPVAAVSWVHLRSSSMRGGHFQTAECFRRAHAMRLPPRFLLSQLPTTMSVILAPCPA